MYSIALVAISAAAAAKGDLREGLYWMTQPGTYNELTSGELHTTWSVSGKILVMVLFSSMGFFGSSCSAAITKNFGALTMSITSTARKATTLFLSFFLFNNVCTWEHLLGVAIFIAALTAKSLRRRKHHSKSSSSSKKKKRRSSRAAAAAAAAGTKHINEQWNLAMEQHQFHNNNRNLSASSTMESLAMASGLATTTNIIEQQEALQPLLNSSSTSNNDEVAMPSATSTPGRASTSGVTQRRAHNNNTGSPRMAHVV
jgi:UAA transporter family